MLHTTQTLRIIRHLWPQRRRRIYGQILFVLLLDAHRLRFPFHLCLAGLLLLTRAQIMYGPVWYRYRHGTKHCLLGLSSNLQQSTGFGSRPLVPFVLSGLGKQCCLTGTPGWKL